MSKKENEKESKLAQRAGISTEELEELKEAFDLFDTDGGGTIDVNELKTAMESLNFDKRNKLAMRLIENMKSGEINFEQFVDMMTAKISEKDSKEEIMKVFKLFDENDKGKINIEDLRRVAKELGEGMTDNELQEMIDRGDLNKNGTIEFDEFYNIMTKKNF